MTLPNSPFLSRFSVKVCDTSTRSILAEIPRPRTLDIFFSPQATFIATWENYEGKLCFPEPLTPVYQSKCDRFCHPVAILSSFTLDTPTIPSSAFDTARHAMSSTIL